MHDPRPEGGNPNNKHGKSNSEFSAGTVADISPKRLAVKALETINDPENPSAEILVKQLPKWAKEAVAKTLLDGLEDWQIEGFNDGAGLQVVTLAAHEVDEGYYRVVAGVQSDGKFLTPSPEANSDSFNNPIIKLNESFSGLIVDIWYIEDEEPEIATNPLLAPRLLRQEIDKFFEGDRGGVLGVELTSRFAQSLKEDVSFTSIRNKSVQVVEGNEVYNFIIELDNGSTSVVEWSIHGDLVGRLNYFEIFPKDQIALIENGVVDESGKGQDISALTGIDNELSGSGYRPIDPSNFEKGHADLINNIHEACLDEFPYLQEKGNITYRISAAWTSKDKKELHLFVSVLNDQEESIVPNFTGNLVDTLQESGVLCKLVCPPGKKSNLPVDKWEVYIDAIGLCEYRLKAELEAIVSPKPEESGLFHYLKERVAGELGLVAEDCPKINRISLNEREKMDPEAGSAPFLLLCETSEGAALVHLHTQFNCALLPIQEVFLSCAWLPNSPKISCFNASEPDPVD